ncbi:hypothetical protein JCM3775_000745 [Rhodotorula graminis]
MRPSREYDDDPVLQQVESMLEQDRRDSSASSTTAAHSRHSSRSHTPPLPPLQHHHHHRPAPRTVLLSHIALVVASAAAARQLSRLARLSSRSTVALPLAHFLVLALAALVYGWLRPSMTHAHTSPSVLELGKGSHLAATTASTRRQAWATGAVVAVCFNLRVLELRAGQPRLSEALEVFAIPAFLALSPWLSTRLSHSNLWHIVPSTPFLAGASATTFLVGFALIGVPARGGALVLALVRIPLEAAALTMVKNGVADEAPLSLFFTGSAISATFTSLVFLPVTYLTLPSAHAPTLGASGYVSFSATLVLTTLASVALLFHLTTTTSALPAAVSIFPRNLILLVWSAFGREGVALRENWIQIVLVYVCGSVALSWTETELYEAFIKSRKPAPPFAPAGSHADTVPPSPASSVTFSSPPAHSYKIPSSASASSSDRGSLSSILSFVPFIPLLAYLITTPATTSSLSSACAYLPPYLRTTVCPVSASAPISRSVDLVIAYYNEDLARAEAHISFIRESNFVRKRSNRVVVYNKGMRTEQEIRKGLKLKWGDEVVPLPNLGREGATYLTHILLHYNSTLSSISPAWQSASPAPPHLAAPLAHLRTTTLADTTYFLQPHLAWDFIAKPRLAEVADETGFAHFGPLLRSECGNDLRAPVNLPVVKELYNVFAGEICPPGGQLAAWSAQMAVSKRRILAQPYKRYSAISTLMEAPEGHWIHDQWGPNESGGPSNPVLGHSLERAWPVIMGCRDVKLVDQCPDEEFRRDLCQCLDR